jgi:hypothetical protein
MMRRRQLGEMPAWLAAMLALPVSISSLWESLPSLSSVGDVIAGAGSGKITPTDEAAVRTQATQAVQAAGGSASDVQQVQNDISAALDAYGGSSLPQYGGSIWPDIAPSTWFWMAIAGLGAVILIHDL